MQSKGSAQRNSNLLEINKYFVTCRRTEVHHLAILFLISLTNLKISHSLINFSVLWDFSKVKTQFLKSQYVKNYFNTFAPLHDIFAAITLPSLCLSLIGVHKI